MAARLNGYLRAARVKPFGYGPGELDCARFVADFVLAEVGVDPLARWRGRYSTEAEADAILRANGGLVGVLAEGLDPLLPRAGAAMVGILDTPAGSVGAVATPHGWAAMTGQGMARLRADAAIVQAQWGWPCS